MIKFDEVKVDEKVIKDLEEMAQADVLYQHRTWRIFWTIVKDNLGLDGDYLCYNAHEALERLKKLDKIKIRRFYGLM